MSLAFFANLLTTLLCSAVLVQSVRMMRSVSSLKTADLPMTVMALENATSQARMVLADLKTTLQVDYQQTAGSLEEATAVRDELHVLIEIANARADRLVEAASTSTRKVRSTKPAKEVAA